MFKGLTESTLKILSGKAVSTEHAGRSISRIETIVKLSNCQIDKVAGGWGGREGGYFSHKFY